MDEISIGSKINCLTGYVCKKIINMWTGAYTKVILDDKIEESDKRCKEINSSFTSKDMFDTKHRVLVLYQKEKNFSTVLIAESYTQINEIVNDMLKNYNSYKRIQLDDSNVMIQRLVLLTKDNEEIDVTDMINMFIKYTEPITICDLSHLCGKKSESIKHMKFEYYKEMEPFEKIFDFQQIKDKDIEFINLMLKNM